MKAIFNNIKEHTLSVISVRPSKKEYCKVLGCRMCRMDIRSIGCRQFGLIQDALSESNYISGNNVYQNPELLGSFIMLGVSNGRLRGLTDEEEEYFKGFFAKWDDGRYVLNWID